MSAFALTPSFELYKSLEACCKDVVEWPPLRPVSPGKGVDAEKYAQLLDAVNLLRDVPKYRPTPAGSAWQSLKPVLVERFEEVGGRFRMAEKKYMRTMARKSASSGLRPKKSLSSAAEGHRNAPAVSNQDKSSDIVQDLHMSVSGDSAETRDDGKDTQMDTEMTVTADNSGLSVDVDDVIKADSAVVEDDAASDVTIVASDVDTNEFCKLSIYEGEQEVKQDVADQVLDNTDDKSTSSVQLPLNYDGLSNAMVSVHDSTTDTKAEQNQSEMENTTNDAARDVSYGNLIDLADEVPPHLQVTNEVVREEEESVKGEVNAANMGQSSEMLDPVGSRMDVDETSENILGTTRVIDKDTSESDALLSSEGYLETDTVVNECGTSVLPSSTHDRDLADSDETQNVKEDLNTVDISASLSLTAYPGSEEITMLLDNTADTDVSNAVLPVTTHSGSIQSLSHSMQSVDLHHSYHPADEDVAMVNVVQPEPVSVQTSAVCTTHESPQKTSTETGLALVDDGTEPGDVSETNAARTVTTDDVSGETGLARVDDGTEPGGVSETNAARMATTDDVSGETSTECSDSETVDCVGAIRTSHSETSISSPMQDSVEGKGMVSVPGSKSDTALGHTVKLSGDAADIMLSRCSVSLYRIPVSDASRNVVDVVPAKACSKLQRRCSVVLQRLSPSLEPALRSLSSSSAPSRLSASEDSAINVIIISDDDDDDVDDVTITSPNDDVPQPLSDDAQCHSLHEETAASEYAGESVQEQMSIDDVTVMSPNDDVPEPLSDDAQCHSLHEETAASEYARESVQEQMSETETNKNCAETEHGEGIEVAAEAVHSCSQDVTSALVNSSAILDGEEVSDITAGEDRVCSNVAVTERLQHERRESAERFSESDETVHDEDENRSHVEDAEHSKQETSADVTVVTACGDNHDDSESSMAVDENLLFTGVLSEYSERTEMPSDPLEPADDWESWHPTNALLNLADDIMNETFESQESAKESEGVADVSYILDDGNKVDSSAAVGLKEDAAFTGTEDAASREVIEHVELEAADRKSSPLGSTNVNLSPSLLPNDESEVTASEDAGIISSGLTEEATVAVTDCNLIAVDSENMDSSEDKENTDLIGIKYSRTSCPSITEAAVVAETGSSLSAFASTNMETSEILSREKGSLAIVTAAESAVFSDVIEPAAVDATDSQLWAREDKDDDTSNAREEATVLCSDVFKTATCQAPDKDLSSLHSMTMDSSAISSHELIGKNSADEDLRTLSNDVTELVAVKATQRKLSVSAMESLSTADAVTVVTEYQMELTESVDAIISECVASSSTSVANIQTCQVEPSGNDTDISKVIPYDENDVSDIVVCDPFPIFSECRTRFDSMDSLKLQDNSDTFTHLGSADRYTGSCGDEVTEDVCALILQPDVPEPSDEIYLCTTAASTRSSSEGQSDGDYEDDVDADWKSHINVQSADAAAADTQNAAATADDVDVNTCDNVVTSSSIQPLQSDSETSNICLNSEQLPIVSMHLDDPKHLDTVPVAMAGIEAATVTSESSNFPVVCSSQDTESCKVQKEKQECRAKEQLNDSEGDFWKERSSTVSLDGNAFSELDNCNEGHMTSHQRLPASENTQETHQEEQLNRSEGDSWKENSSTVTLDGNACSELDTCNEGLVTSHQHLPAYHENTQETHQEVITVNRAASSMSAMLDKLVAVCKNVRQKVQSKGHEPTTREEPRTVVDKPVCESSNRRPSTVSPSSALHSYSCPYCLQTFLSYTAYISHLRAESARNASEKSTLADSEHGKSVQQSTMEAETVAVSTKSRRGASSATGRSPKPSLTAPQTSNSSLASQQRQLDAGRLHKRKLPVSKNSDNNLSHRVPAKSRLSLSNPSVSSGKPQKQSLSASHGSDSAAAVQAKLETPEFSTPVPAKCGRHSLPKSFHKGNAPASTGRSHKRKLSVSVSSDNSILSDDSRTENQQSQKEKMSRPVAAKSHRSSTKASSSDRSQKPLTSALASSDTSMGRDQGRPETEKASDHKPAKSRCRSSKSVSQHSATASTGGSKKTAARESSDHSAGKQQTKRDSETFSRQLPSKSRRGLPKKQV